MKDTTLLKFIQNTETPEELREILDWLDASPENRKYLNQLDDLDSASTFWAPDLQQSRRIGRKIRWERIARWTTAAAAAIVVGLGSGFFLYENRISEITEQHMSTIAPKGQRMQIRLSDGSSVWLNAGSTITYPPIFARSERRVHLSGEAIFEVVHDEKCPFVVETFACDAKVLGTRFDITANEQEEKFSAALLEGQLQLISHSSEEVLTMTPNEIVHLTHGKFYRQELADHDNFLWTEGIISLKGLSFEELMAKFELAFNVRIVIERKKMPVANFGWGKIEVSSGIEHAMEVLRCATDFEYEIDKNTGEIKIL